MAGVNAVATSSRQRTVPRSRSTATSWPPLSGTYAVVASKPGVAAGGVSNAVTQRASNDTGGGVGGACQTASSEREEMRHHTL